ncbi:MAG: hypothetical protein ACLFWI_10470, partial [Coleofasciculus sp.]|uniref:hypothetical protein n=1 Tax=Coleofasciculus sp. TaxID=3100458 RepID=UPI003A462560
MVINKYGDGSRYNHTRLNQPGIATTSSPMFPRRDRYSRDGYARYIEVLLKFSKFRQSSSTPRV